MFVIPICDMVLRKVCVEGGTSRRVSRPWSRLGRPGRGRAMKAVLFCVQSHYELRHMCSNTLIAVCLGLTGRAVPDLST